MLASNTPPDVISPFFNRLVQSIRSQDSIQVQSLFQFYLPPPIPREIQAFIAAIRFKPLAEILQFSEKASQKLETYKDFQGGDLDAQWCTLGGLYLQYLYEYNEADGLTQLENFSKFFSLYTVVFNRSAGTWMIPITKRLIQQVIALAHNTQIQLVRKRAYDTTYPFETPAKLLQRLLNSIMSDRSGLKKSIAYFIGNQLLRCYFKMNNHRMCKMVFDTLSKSGIEVTSLKKADRVTFEYYQGRFELHHLHFRKAREHLLYCFDNVHLQTPKQQRLILIYLIASSLPIGIFPSPILLQQFSLNKVFSPIIQAVKDGNFQLLSSSLNGPSRPWLRSMGLYILFQDRLETLTWRVFIRKAFLATYLPLRAQNPKAHTSISLDLVASLANAFLSRAAAERGEDFIPWDADDIVGICINLIDQGYVKGHIAMERRILVLPKTEPFGFTRISDVRANSRVTGVQILPDTEGRFEEI